MVREPSRIEEHFPATAIDFKKYVTIYVQEYGSDKVIVYDAKSGTIKSPNDYLVEIVPQGYMVSQDAHSYPPISDESIVNQYTYQDTCCCIII